MKNYGFRIAVFVGVCLLMAGCLNKMRLFGGEEPLTGTGSGKWQLVLNDTITYKFDFDRRYFESVYTCEIGCSGRIESWALEDGDLLGKTSCDMIYVTFEGKAKKDSCEGTYKIYTLTGEFLREGVFTGKPM